MHLYLHTVQIKSCLIKIIYNHNCVAANNIYAHISSNILILTGQLLFPSVVQFYKLCLSY